MASARINPESKHAAASKASGQHGRWNRSITATLFSRTLLLSMSSSAACLAAFFAISYLSFVNAVGAGGESAAEIKASLPGKVLAPTALGGLVIMGVFGLSAFLYSSYVSKTIETIRRALARVAIGDMSTSLHLGKALEFQGLDSEFNRAVGAFKSLLSEERRHAAELALIRKAVDSSGDAILIREYGTGVAYLNKTFADLTGCGAAKDLSLDAELGLYVDRTSASDMLDAVERGDAWYGEVEIKTPGGRIIPVSLRSNSISNSEGEIIGRIGIYSDISDKRRMEQALLESEEKYRVLFDGNPNPMWVYDVQTLRFLAVNQAAMRAYGYSRDDYLGMAVLDMTPAEDRAALLEVFASDPKDLRRREWKQLKKDGAVVDVEMHSRPLNFAGRNARIAQGIDISERKRMEEAVRRSEVEYRSLFENANDAILIFDSALRRVIEANSKAAEMYGYGRQELIGAPIDLLTRRQQGHRETGGKDAFAEMETGSGSNLESAHYRKDGSEIAVLVNSSTIDYRGKKAVLALARDVTERKVTERALKGSLDEFLRVVSAVSEGDLTTRGAGDQGQFRGLGVSFNAMLDSFGDMLTRIKQIGLSLTSSATQILAAAEEIAAGSQRQADEITNTSSAVEEMAASMGQVSRNAEASVEAARRALGMAEHGARFVRDTSEAMTRIDFAVKATAEKMRLLAGRSTEISEIIELINDIAAQTNLLSLNAAIEAAHAGEAGVGFSVVADEIRKLAERSARATRDVGSLIQAIQTETGQALEAMERGMEEVKGGNALAEEARQSLEDIGNVVRRSSELIDEISAASEEQARVTRNLAGAMQTVSSITLETSAGAHETAQTIQGMVGLTEQLNASISRFKIKGDSAIGAKAQGGDGRFAPKLM